VLPPKHAPEPEEKACALCWDAMSSSKLKILMVQRSMIADAHDERR
jgi:hypothetical protein